MSSATHYVVEDKLRELLISVQDTNDKKAKEDLGEIILKIVNRLATKSNFGGYTYKEELKLRAIEYILLYGIKNYDRNMISPITGVRTKAFSYITDIARRAFISVINDMKEEEKEIRENIIPYEEAILGMNNIKYRDIESFKDTHELEIFLDYFENGSLIHNNKSYPTLFDFIKTYNNKTKLKIIYPKEYSISLSEYSDIINLNFEFLNINKFQEEKYKPSFPKKQKKQKEKTDLSEEWS